MSDLEDRIDKVLDVEYIQHRWQYVATSSIPHTHTVTGYGKSEKEAESSLLKRILSASYTLRWKFFKAIDNEFGRQLEEAPVGWSIEFGDKSCKVIITDDLGRTSSRVIKIVREECHECGKKGTSKFEE